MPKKKASEAKKTKTSKGKKDGKPDARADRESEAEKAKANAALWELRLKVTDQSLGQYRDACRTLAQKNEELYSVQYRVVKDSIDITNCLQREREEKYMQALVNILPAILTHVKDGEKSLRRFKITLLQNSLKSQEARAREEQNKLTEEHTLQLNEMKELFRKRSSDFSMIQDGMRKIEEFQKRKTQMEQELSDIRECMDNANKEHRESLNSMEYRFFKEKARLEKEAEEAIAKAAEQAHSEAIVQLDEASRCVFRENVRLKEALKYHMKEAEDLHKLTESMAKQNASLTMDKNTFEQMVKKNAAQMAAQKDELSALRGKVTSLEQALELKDRELRQEGKEEMQKMLLRTQADEVKLEKLQRALAVRNRELGDVRHLASTIVEQRTELERFFHESLAQVKEEIEASRTQYKKEALQAYRWRLREATAGKLEFPPIRTFRKSPHSTNSVYSDMEAAAAWTHQPGSKVEVSDMTWEQKEQVLRLLFAKMNGQRQRRVDQQLALSAFSEKKSLVNSDAAGIREELSPATFITQAPESSLPSNPNSLPDMRTT